VTTAYRPVGPWLLLVLAVGFVGGGALMIWLAATADVHARFAAAVFLLASGLCGAFLGMLALLEYVEQVRAARWTARLRRADRYIEDALHHAAQSDDERTAA